MDTLHEQGAVQPQIDLNSMARELLEDALNAMMDEQASELGAVRNGYRERRLDTCVGPITLKIPKLREGTYFPDDIVERWSRTDTALASAVCDMWAEGVSTRKVEKVMADMGVGPMSRSRVSRLCSGLDAEVEKLRRCDLSWQRWPYLWLDATYVPCREAHAARSTAVVGAVVAGEDGARRVAAVECVDCESYQSWRDFLLKLRGRGLSGVRLVVSDAHAGLVRAIKEVFAGAAWQRCIAHLQRNVMERCRRKGDGAAAVAALKAAFSETDPALVEAGYGCAAGLLAEADAAGAELLEEARPFALNYLAFPPGAQDVGAHEQHPGEDERGDKEEDQGGAGVPVGGVAAAPGGGRVLRPERRMAVFQELHRPAQPRRGLRAGTSGGQVKRAAPRALFGARGVRCEEGGVE